MMHPKRLFGVTDVGSSEDLAEKLTHHTWTLCTGFRHAGYLYLNDSTSEDGVAEYAVFNEKTGRQVESITFGWYKPDKFGLYNEALGYIRKISAGEHGCISATPLPRIDSNRPHRCGACA